MSLMTDVAWKICQRNGGYWGEHLGFPLKDWKREVANNDTREGYWNWVNNKVLQDKKEAA